MQYAVIKTGGKQYKVAPGDIIEVDSISDSKDNVEFSEVLLVNDEGKLNIGTPFISGVSVQATVLGQTKGDKIRVAKFKAKARFRRVTGFRASLTKVQINTIGSMKAAKETKAKEAEVVAEKKPVKKTKKA